MQLPLQVIEILDKEKDVQELPPIVYYEVWVNIPLLVSKCTCLQMETDCAHLTSMRGVAGSYSLAMNAATRPFYSYVLWTDYFFVVDSRCRSSQRPPFHNL